MEFPRFKITSKKAIRNDINFSPWEITLNKARQNGVKFSPIKITSEKFFKVLCPLGTRVPPELLESQKPEISSNLL